MWTLWYDSCREFRDAARGDIPILWGMILGCFWDVSGMFWRRLWIVLGICWRCCGDVSGIFWHESGMFRSCLKGVWGKLGGVWGMFGGCFGSVFGTSGDQPGANL